MGGGKRSEGGGGGKGGKCVWRGYNIPDLASLITRLVLRYVGIGRDSATVSYSRHYGRAASGWHAGPGRSGSSGGLGARHHRHRSLKPALGRGCGSAGPGGPGCGPRVAEATARAAGPMLHLVTDLGSLASANDDVGRNARPIAGIFCSYSAVFGTRSEQVRPANRCVVAERQGDGAARLFGDYAVTALCAWMR